jgi:putative ABC transport system ATP-binding protein
MSETPILVQLCDVSKTYGDHMVTALNHVSLAISEGEFLAIMGPSGCGKSTLLNIVGGIDTPSIGKVFFSGNDLTTYKDEALTALRRTEVGFIFQFFNLLSTLTLAENVSLPLELENVKTKTVRELVSSVLAKVNMSQRASFYPSQLSGGEMQRVAIARALVHSPKLVIADEPTGNLDTDSGAAVLTLLRDLHREHKTTVVMATHSQEAASYADRVVDMRDGSIIGEKRRCAQP